MNVKTKLLSFIMAFAAIVGCLIACNSESDKDLSVSNPNSELTETEQILINYNNRMPSMDETRGLTTGHWINIAIKDAKGAYRGGKLGGKLGGLFGPHGATVGTVVGGVIVGGAASYIQYNKYENEVFIGLRNKPDLSPDGISIKSFASAYIENKTLHDDVEYKLGLDNGLDSCSTLIGILHNDVLDNVEYHRAIQKYEHNKSKMSNIEKYIVESDDLNDMYNSLFENEDTSTNEGTVDESDKIINLFADVVRKNVSSEKDLHEIILFYVNIVSASTTLSQEDKESLLAAFSVMGYSYQYWSNKFKSVKL